MATVEKIQREESADGVDLSPGWVVETVAIWSQFPARKGILDLTRRNLVTLPEELYRLRKLKELDIHLNKLVALPGELSKLAEAEELEKIDCSSNQIAVVEEGVAEVQSLKHLNLSLNCFAIFPDPVGKLKQLTELDLSGNQMVELSPALGGATALTILRVNDNALGNIEVVGKLFNLEELYAGNNQLEALPESILSLFFLKHLDVCCNSVTAIPEKFGGLTAMTYLDVSFNSIQTLPDSMEKMIRLKTFKMNNNEITKIPTGFGFLQALTEWNFEENPLQGVEEGMTRNSLLMKLRAEIRGNRETRKLLFTEKDSKANNRFEIIEGEDKPVLVAATPEKLTVFLTQVAIPDVPTMHVYLNTYSYYLEPDDIVNLFVLRYEMNNTSTQNKEAKRVEEIIRVRVLAALVRFIQRFNSDGNHLKEETLKLLEFFMAGLQGAGERQIRNALAENTLYASRLGTTTAKELDKEALKQKGKEEKMKKKKEKERQKKLEKEKKRLEKNTKKRKKEDPKGSLGISLGLPPGVSGAPVSSAGSQLQMLAFTAADIATEMAVVNSELFSRIPLQEFLHQRWQKKGMEEKGANILAAINQFNDFTNVFATAIVTQTDLKGRLKTLQHILDIAAESMEIGDFSSVFSIASALGAASVSRLKQTWGLLDDKRRGVHEALNSLIDNSGNFSNYKHALDARVAEGRLVPHLAMYLSNLTFMEDGNPTFVDDTDVINLGKFRMITRTIDEVDKMQQMTYVDLLDENPIIRNVIQYSDKLDSEAQYAKSLECEASNRKPTISITMDDATLGKADKMGSGISASCSMMAMSTKSEAPPPAAQSAAASRRSAFQSREGGLRAGQRSQTDFNLVHYTKEPAPAPPGPAAPLPNEI
mmetsp:Transcript_1209/g.4340  ORF Transcript_1209/g.4340 Transcript_1209/m.4340 type:complete len:876 (-) Transcript_1209:1226-3853(-)